MRRRLLLILAAVFAAVVVAVLMLPWWLGLALRGAPDSIGLTFADYERVSYGRFALRDVEYRRKNVRVKISRVEADTPLVWWWRGMRDRPSELVAERWSVEVLPKPPEAAAVPRARASGWVPLHATLRRVAAQLDRWVPAARAGEGSVRWKNGELSIGAAKWAERRLRVDHFAMKAARAHLEAEFPEQADEIRVNARTIEQAGTVALASRGADVVGEVIWWEQPARLTARFAERGWLPERAVLEGKDWTLPAAKLRLGAAYATVRGSGRVEWSEKLFRTELAAAGEPIADKKAPPLEVNLRAHGDLQEFTVETLRAVLPGVIATLSAPVTVNRRGEIQGEAARFAVETNFAELPWFTAEGSARGEARVVSRSGASPVAEFDFAARDVAAHGVSIARADLAGRLDWPRIEIARATLVGGNGEQLDARGAWDFRAKEISAASVRGEVRRATLARWLPTQPGFEAIAVRAEASGPLAELKHAGELRAGNVTLAGVKPLAVALRWNGSGVAVEQFDAHAIAGATRLTVKGGADRAALRLDALELAKEQNAIFRLTAPAVVRWRPALHIEELHLAGPDGGIDAQLTWGETGRVAFAARNFASAWLSDLVDLPGPAWRVNSLAITGTWDRGPMKFSAVLGAAIELGEGRRATVNLAGQGDGDGLRLEALRAAEGAESIVHATGNLPIVFTPGAARLMTIDDAAPLTLDAATAPNAAFWQEIASLTGLELQDPKASVQLGGTWPRPLGDVRLQAARVAADPKRFQRPVPTVEGLNVAVVAAPDGLRLETFSLKVEGQAIVAAGKLPVAETEWAQALKEPLAFARRGAELRLEIPDAEIAAFARFLPSVFAPKGRLQVDLAYHRGAMEGTLRLNDAATRPLGPLGVLQDIDADVRLAGDALELRGVRATSGGEDVRLTGRIELPMLRLPANASAEEKEPRFEVALKGNNLPFVRRAGLLLRGDVDLKLNTTQRGAERVTGTVRLRDSLFLQDVRGLLPRGASSRARRPPYFSVENAPLNRWQLDVNVVGEQFMRLRTTVFNGIASARFHLGGTLEEPIAIGDVIIDEGRIRLPFASFEVREARVMLTREQPFEPQIWLAAETRRYGYDLRMEMTGAATAPVLAFSSSPPLEHGQVLLMVMAGEAPKQEVTYTDQQRATKLGTYLGQSLLASFGDSGGGDRLIISSGEKISEQGRETIEVEYQLNDRWSLTGEYDEFDDYNAGVKVRVYSREGGGEAKDEKR